MLIVFLTSSSIRSCGRQNLEYMTNMSTDKTNLSKTKEYKPYNLNDPNNCLILSQQNAGNIEVLKDRINNLDKMNTKYDKLQETVLILQQRMEGLVQQQATYAQEIAGGDKPPTISGLE